MLQKHCIIKLLLYQINPVNYYYVVLHLQCLTSLILKLIPTKTNLFKMYLLKYLNTFIVFKYIYCI